MTTWAQFVRGAQAFLIVLLGYGALVWGMIGENSLSPSAQVVLAILGFWLIIETISLLSSSGLLLTWLFSWLLAKDYYRALPFIMSSSDVEELKRRHQLHLWPMYWRLMRPVGIRFDQLFMEQVMAKLEKAATVREAKVIFEAAESAYLNRFIVDEAVKEAAKDLPFIYPEHYGLDNSYDRWQKLRPTFAEVIGRLADQAVQELFEAQKAVREAEREAERERELAFLEEMIPRAELKDCDWLLYRIRSLSGPESLQLEIRLHYRLAEMAAIELQKNSTGGKPLTLEPPIAQNQ